MEGKDSAGEEGRQREWQVVEGSAQREKAMSWWGENFSNAVRHGNNGWWGVYGEKAGKFTVYVCIETHLQKCKKHKGMLAGAQAEGTVPSCPPCPSVCLSVWVKTHKAKV